MRKQTLANESSNVNKGQSNLNWKDSPSIQKLLDVIANIIATEYVQTARENPTVFLKIASPATIPGGLAMTRGKK